MNTSCRLLFAGSVLMMVCAEAARGGVLDEEPPPRKPQPKIVQAFLLPEKPDGVPGRFTTDAVKISVGWRGQGLKAGDHLTAVWIAEDLGIASQRESKITDESATAYKPDDDGAFALGRPKEGWPPGRYRVEIYLNGQLAQIIRFTIEPGATIEVR